MTDGKFNLRIFYKSYYEETHLKGENVMFENFDIWYDNLGSDDDRPFVAACRDREVKNDERWVLVSFTVEEANKICEYIQEQICLHEKES